MSNDFPSSKFDRGKIFAKTGLKLGTNYAKRYVKNKVGQKETADETSRFHSDNARQVFNEFSKLRGTALKIAQQLSLDQGVLPDEFADVMSNAQYSVPPINKALARSIIKKELGDYPEKLFDDFNPKAVAAASIGQVHEARLKSGEKVAIKIQYPNVRNTIDSDLSLAKSLLKRFVKKGADLAEYFDEIKKTLLEETDYEQEAEYLDYFYGRFEHDYIVTPKLYKEYSTKKVLTMSFIEGKHLKEFLNDNPTQEERNRYGQLLWDFFHDQVEQRDFIHADTHPGNFMITGDGTLGVIDFGCVKKFPISFTRNYMSLLPHHLEKSKDEIRELYVQLNIIRENPDDPKKEEYFFKYCKKYGDIFARPYQEDFFDFGSTDFNKKIKRFAKNAPVMNEPRGDKNFLFSTRMHTGLYNLLVKLEAVVDTRRSKELTHKMIEDMNGIATG
ncbi:MAG: AarF/ABC1/UbiB kinase family protein [Balneolaceae bacterium]|nr:AarF/ABC1/UbiB kinase family protein [Balneolaceae bacterium]